MAATSENRDDLEKLLPLAPASFFILFALVEGEKHGYAIMQEVGTLSNGKVKVGPATLYTSLQRLLDCDLIEETAARGKAASSDARRRYYKLTRAGKRLLQMEISRMESLVQSARGKKLVFRAVE